MFSANIVRDGRYQDWGERQHKMPPEQARNWRLESRQNPQTGMSALLRPCRAVDFIDAALVAVTIPCMAADQKTFRDACCDRLGIPKASFEKKVLLATLPGYYRLLGFARWYLNRSYFKPDLELIRAVADSASLREVRAEITFFHHQKQRGVQRNFLHFRISGKRLLSFAHQFLP